MDKQKQIDEMAKIIGCDTCDKDCPNRCAFCSANVKKEAEMLYNEGYRKIPEGAVVLTKEEHKKLKHGSGTLEKLYNQYPFRVLVGFNSMVFCQDRECFERLYDEIEERASKETAEKFAERLKDEVLNFCGTVEENGYFERSKRCFCDDIDEICKELTGGK